MFLHSCQEYSCQLYYLFVFNQTCTHDVGKNSSTWNFKISCLKIQLMFPMIWPILLFLTMYQIFRTFLIYFHEQNCRFLCYFHILSFTILMCLFIVNCLNLHLVAIFSWDMLCILYTSYCKHFKVVMLLCNHCTGIQCFTISLCTVL